MSARTSVSEGPPRPGDPLPIENVPEPTRRCINLTFHGVGERTRRLQPGEEDVWLSLEQFSSVLDAVAGRSDVRIGFDDGNASDLNHALPALRARGLNATFFVVAGRLATPGFLDGDEVGMLAAAGMTIGCHGMHHRRWRKLGEHELREEMLASRRLLEEIVAQPVTQAACPFGSYDRRVLSSLRRYGYDRVFTSDRGTTRPDRWVQARNTLRRGDSGNVIEEIARLDMPPQRAIRRQAKLAIKRWR